MESIIDIMLRSIMVSGAASIVSALWSVPVAIASASSPRLEKTLIPVMESLVGVPTILVGLLVYVVLSRSGPLGFLGLLYTPYAMIMGQAILVTPIVVTVSYIVLKQAWITYAELAYSLGATRRQALMLAASHSLPGLASALVMGFSRAVGELGVALIVGGNIEGRTRVASTAILVEAERGNISGAIWLGFILVLVMIGASIASRILRRVSGVD